MPKLLDFRCAVITGGGGGIGKAMARHLVSKGKTVLLAGRTESNLQSAARDVGAAGYYLLDVGKTADISPFVRRITREHPELDCLVNNAGVQRPLDVLQDGDFTAKADQEIDINVRGPMHLTLGLLPHLQTKPGAVIINAWLHFWSMNLRTQLRRAGSGVRVVEIAPPMVATDLHREREDPDDNKKQKNAQALGVDEFMGEVARKLERGDEMISAGGGSDIVEKWYGMYGALYDEAASKK
ncbi:short-chain dehydrogenase [Metarhizium brunneum]